VTITIADSKQFIGELKEIGVKAKAWRASGDRTPPADVNYRGELRIHTGGQPELVATDGFHRQAIVRPTTGAYRGDSFLIGMDETANFVCRLPQGANPTTVEEAHDILRPKGVMPHTIRQGEWFFVPTDKCSCGLGLDDHVRGHGVSVRLQGTTHTVEQGIVHGGSYYAKGRVMDDREGRHADVDLGDKWHQVFHNTERDMMREPDRVRRFD
jgi:hypothetical protein